MLEHALGRGGMATVWLGRDERLERPVAVKVLAEGRSEESGYLARFKREVRVAARLNHPHLVRIYDSGASAGRPFLVMEYIAGGDLAGLTAAGRAPEPDRLARELLGALRYIHAARVLHRDVKAENVLIGGAGDARLSDFGIAQPRGASSLTETGTLVGTARYLAPEVLGGEAQSERSDLYSLGVVLGSVLEARPGTGAVSRLADSLRAPDPDDRPRSAEAALRLLSAGEAPTPALTLPGGTARLRVAGARPGTAAVAARGRDGRPARLAGEAGGVRRRLRRRGPLALAAASTAVALVAGAVAIGALGGSDAGDPGAGGEQAAAAAAGPGADPGGARGSPGPAPADGEGRTAGAVAFGAGAASGASSAASGERLNDRGYSLIRRGRPAEAVPLLRRAVAALGGSGEITYAYALFNLGRAMRLVGRPEAAVPILERRLRIPDQRGVVRTELAAARAAAGSSGRGDG